MGLRQVGAMLWRKTKQKVVIQAHEVETGHRRRKETRKKGIDERVSLEGGQGDVIIWHDCC